jgi:hypothetical protein
MPAGLTTGPQIFSRSAADLARRRFAQRGNIMHGTQSALQLILPLALEMDCPKCGKTMRLAQIVPGEPGYDLRTFECVACDQSVTNAVPI